MILPSTAFLTHAAFVCHRVHEASANNVNGRSPPPPPCRPLVTALYLIVIECMRRHLVARDPPLPCTHATGRHFVT